MIYQKKHEAESRAFVQAKIADKVYIDRMAVASIAEFEAELIRENKAIQDLGKNSSSPEVSNSVPSYSARTRYIFQKISRKGTCIWSANVFV